MSNQTLPHTDTVYVVSHNTVSTVAVQKPG